MQKLMDAVNDLSLATIGQWGVQMHNDRLWELQHNLLVAHNPSRVEVVENRLIGIEHVAEMLIHEVHDDLVDQKLVPHPALNVW